MNAVVNVAGERSSQIWNSLLLPDPTYSGGLLSGKIGHLSFCPS